MIEESVDKIEARANNMRKNIIKMLKEAGSGHPGGSLSAADIVASLYFGGVMNYSEADPQHPERDYFILSKGHAAPVLYAALAELGYVPEDELLTLRKLHSRLQGHPDSKKLPGVEVSTGSLGQGLSIAAGVALGVRIDQQRDGGPKRRVFTLLGDGEIEEGQVWEAAMFAAHYHLDNLVAIVDNNNLQIDGDVRDVAGLDNISSKFKSFGWQTIEVDGHDVGSRRRRSLTVRPCASSPTPSRARAFRSWKTRQDGTARLPTRSRPKRRLPSSREGSSHGAVHRDP